MSKIILRNDDVNENTNLNRLCEVYETIKKVLPFAEIWSCVTLFSQKALKESVYEDVPFRNNPSFWFYQADQFMQDIFIIPNSRIVSHGLYHVDHSKLDRDAQEMSILGSCHYLKTKIFVPPFNRFNKETIQICQKNNIKLIGLTGSWKSLEHENFKLNHSLWYFHSWRFNSQEIGRILTGDVTRNVTI